MATTNVTMRMDEELKAQAEELFADLGLNMTSAFTVFVKQAVREQCIPFKISRAVTNEETMEEARIKSSERIVRDSKERV
ncbi:MAG: type II toxin-antitoxin system RelB/DinJ family antitoxin [Lachnospiraceae bacterium]|nr:type II toxin-antitoxin system RelB/DinJ family antitoxin [Lachnospiraceae bacterium]